MTTKARPSETAVTAAVHAALATHPGGPYCLVGCHVSWREDGVRVRGEVLERRAAGSTRPLALSAYLPAATGVVDWLSLRPAAGAQREPT